MAGVNDIKVSDYESEYAFYNFILPKIKRDFFHSEEWENIRNIILERDLYTCQECGADCKSNKDPQIDHIEPITRNWEKRLDPKNLQVLCSDCNRLKSNNYSDYTVHLIEQLKPLIKLKEKINLIHNAIQDIEYEFKDIEKMFKNILKEKVHETYKNYEELNNERQTATA